MSKDKGVSLKQWLIGAIKRLEDAGFDDCAVEASCLLTHIGGITPSRQLAYPDTVLEPQVLTRLEQALLKRLEHMPTAYIIGKASFMNLDLEVGSGVLIPRPETEALVATAVATVLGQERSREAALKVLDTCTGSGAVGLAVADELGKLGFSIKLTLVDTSAEALEYARRNVNALGWRDRVQIFQEDLWPVACGNDKTPRFDLIVANPPYIALAEKSDLMPDVSQHEPELALFAEQDGFSIIKRIVSEAPHYLCPNGILLLEHGYKQGPAALAIIKASGGDRRVIQATDDLGYERVAGYIWEKKDG